MGPNVESEAALVLFVTLVGVALILLLFLFLGFRREVVKGKRCPYCGAILQFGSDVANSIQQHVNAYVHAFSEEDNPEIDFSKAAICPTSGYIFQECVVRNNRVTLDWSFLSKRLKGSFISWGALPEEEKGIFRLLHLSMEGYQTEKSSPTIQPDRVEEEYARLIPGPLYVDRNTKILMGWVRVPGTNFQVLIIRRPQFQSVEETL